MRFIGVSLVSLFVFGMLFAASHKEAPKRGKYHYPYKGAHIVCRDGETWQMGAVCYKLKGPIPCTITDPATGKTVFEGVEPDIVVFIQE